MNTTFGPALKEWRNRRRVIQLDLGSLVGVSARHISFLETGRSKPSREMVYHLSEFLEVPLSERNALLSGLQSTGRWNDTIRFPPWRSTGTGTWFEPTTPPGSWSAHSV